MRGSHRYSANFICSMKAHWPISILSTLSSVVAMALPLILVRTLDPETIGIFKIFFLYLMILPPITFIAGISSGLSYWAGRGEEGKKAIRISGILFLIISTVILLGLLLLKIPISNGIHVTPDWITLFAFGLFLAIASLFYDDAAIATGRIWTGAIFNSSFELLRTGVIVVTAILTHDLKMIIKAHLAVQSVKVVSGYFLAYRQDLIHWEWDPKIFSKVMRYATPVSLAFLFGFCLNYTDQLILSKTISPAEFAMYTVCCLTVPPLLVLETSVTRILIPQLSKAFAEQKLDVAAKLYQRAVNDLAFLIIPAVTGLFVFAAPIIELLFTKTYLPGTHYLRLYSLWYLTLLIPPDSVARAQGQSKWILGNFICFSIITVASCFYFGSYFGAMGVLSGLLLARASSRLYTLYYFRKTLGWKLRECVPLHSIYKMSTRCAVLGFICLAVHPLFNSSFTWFITCGTAFAIAYLKSSIPLLSDQEGNPRKVLMLTPGLAIGGLEKMIFNLSKSLKQNSAWQPQVYAYDFATKENQGNDLIPSFHQSQIPVHATVKPPRFSFKTALQIAKHANRNGITVIHTHDLGALIYGACAKILLANKIRLIHTQHSFVHLNHSWKYRHYERFFTRFADSIAVVSNDTKHDYLKLGVPETKLHLIPNGVSFPKEPEQTREERLKRRSPSHPLLKDSFLILYLARIHQGKGQDHALKVWAELDPMVRKQSILAFVGPEAAPGELSKLLAIIADAPDSDRILLVGASHSPEEWIAAADLFLSSSEFEGMPLAPVEAVGSGLPAVLSQIPGHEFLSPYAELYELNSPSFAAKAIERVFETTVKDENRFRNKLWNQSAPLRSSFTLEHMSTQYQNLYEIPI